jgi:molecular chaperone HtpG
MNAETKTKETQTQFEFQAEVSRLLGIVTNALYSNKDIFLRELISNASDACDKLRYEAIANPALTSEGGENFRIDIQVNPEERQIIIRDNGIGMDREDLIDNLGTIARSGTARMMEQLKAMQEQDTNAAGDVNLIGQFGVGFYASFMVAQRVDVITTKSANDSDNNVWLWSSDGMSGYALDKADDAQSQMLLDGRGTAIILNLKPDASDYLIKEKLEQIIVGYSDHIALPIFLTAANENTEDAAEPINQASAIWARPKNELTDEDYQKFYGTLGFSMDEPLLTMHWRAEGKIEFTGLLYTPTMRPYDLFDPSRKHSVRLYVKRVFITDQCENLVFPWLRFLKGVIDCQDLQLNISREMLQQNPLIHTIRRAIARKVLGELLKLSRNDAPAYETFWGQFGMILKEGLYDAVDHRDDLFKLCRFYSSSQDGYTGLEDYTQRMKEGQDKIYYITGENPEALKKSPHLEGYKSRGLEVLIMSDTIDSFWLQNAPEFDGKAFQSVTKGTEDLSRFDEKETTSKETNDKQDQGQNDNANESDIDALIVSLKEELGEDVADIRVSNRLTTSPACLIAHEQGVDMHMENVLKIQQHYQPSMKRILEINPDHGMIKAMAAQLGKSDADGLPLSKGEAATLLLDQAKILQGEKPDDPAAFAQSMTALMQKAFQ